MKICRKILISAGALLGLVILISILHHYQLRNATEAYIAQLKAQGEPLDLAQVIPPTVSPEQNGAVLLREADAVFNGTFTTGKNPLETNQVYGMQSVARGKAIICWQQPEIREYTYFATTNSWENIAAAVAKNEKVFALLQQITEKPVLDFHFPYEQGALIFESANPYLSQLKKAAQWLSFAVLSDLHRGDTAAAVKNLHTLLAMVKAMHDERLINSEQVRMSITYIAQSVTWEILQSPDLTEEQLAALQQDWIDLEFIQAGKNALAMELAEEEISLTAWRHSNAELQKYFAAGNEPGASFFNSGTEIVLKKLKPVRIFLWRYWWSYTDELRMLKSYEVLKNTLQMADTNGYFQKALSFQAAGLDQSGISGINQTMESLFPDMTDFHTLLSESAASQIGFAEKIMWVEVVRRMSVTAIALKRYQLKHGNYPGKIFELIPEFLSSVPLDPVDGQPLRYQPNADGTYRLYSIGENGKDDGGNSSMKKNSTYLGHYWLITDSMDWVWPQPATAAEIKSYYDHLPK